MANTHLNYFFPYSGDVGHFETSLTRAFFTLLNLSPVLHAHLIGMIRDQAPALPLPSFFDLQPESFRLDLELGSQNPSCEYENAVLVHFTGTPAPRPASAAKTEDSRRYDAVLAYDSGWAFLCESKIGAADQKDTHARVSGTLHGVVEIGWNGLIEAVWRLMECGLLCRTDEKLAEQFLEYVETKFENLSPYSSIARCRGSRARVDARCTQILRGFGTAFGNKLDLGMGAMARYAVLRHAAGKGKDESFVVLGLYPADTINQARRFYTKANIEATVRLKQRGWDVYPDLHLSFMQTSCLLLKGNRRLDEYLRYWLDHMPQHGQIVVNDDVKNSFLVAFEQLVAEGFASESDRSGFAQQFIDTRRTKMNICPGVGAEYYWPLKRAEELDAQGRFAAEISERLQEALGSWGQALPSLAQIVGA